MVSAFAALLAGALLAAAAHADCADCVGSATAPQPQLRSPRLQPAAMPPISAWTSASSRAELSAFEISVAQATAQHGIVGAASTARAATGAGVAILERAVRISADCVDEAGNAYPAAQTFASTEVDYAHVGELYRCGVATRVRVLAEGVMFDCAARDAVWHELAQLSCRPRLPRDGAFETALWRQYGAGEKLVRLRDARMNEAAGGGVGRASR